MKEDSQLPAKGCELIQYVVTPALAGGNVKIQFNRKENSRLRKAFLPPLK